MFDPLVWAAVPFHFWSGVFFVFGSIVGSLLNVCIHRMPLGQSIVTPPSHCPHCQYSIPWYLNIPLLTWLYLRGKCANCQAPISIRYFLVELLTGLLFMAAWIQFGEISPWLALIYCLFISGLIVATFIDFEHFIIPDEITIGGIFAGFIFSALVPELHADLFSNAVPTRAEALKSSMIGIAVGAGIIYGVLRLGKLLFGRQTVTLSPDTRLVFTEEHLKLPDGDVPYSDLFYRKTDAIFFEAKTLELADRCYFRTSVRLSPDLLEIGDEKLNPAEITHMEAVADEIVLPREAMGFGDVKFMGAIGAFIGWQGVLFTLMFSAAIGAIIGSILNIIRRKSGAGHVPYIPYGPYLALAALLWLFGGKRLAIWWFGSL